MPARLAALVLGAAALAGPAWAEIASVETPQGLARVEKGDGYGDRVLIGDRVAVDGADLEDGFEGAYLWIEAAVGTLLLVGLGSDGTACPALFVWVHAGPGDQRVTEPFGTCLGYDGGVEVSHDSETVTVGMASLDPDRPRSLFVYDGKGPVREVPQGQAASASGPEAGAGPWIGRYPQELFESSDWRGPLVALMGPEGYGEAQDGMEVAEPMAADGGWVAGWGADPNNGLEVAVAIARDDGRLLVVVRREDGTSRLWGDPRGALPEAVAGLLAPPGP